MTLLEAARQALPGLEWSGDDSEVVSSVKSGIRVVIWPNGDGYIHVRVGQEITRYPSPQSVALRLRRDLALRCDELDAIAGLRPRAELEADLAALREQMAAARVAVEKWRFRECCAGCGEGGNENAQCYTDAVENDAARTEARGAVGLEE